MTLSLSRTSFCNTASAVRNWCARFKLRTNPALMMISERGALGDHQLGQAIVCRTMRPVLASLGIDHHVITRLDETGFIVGEAIRQAVATQAPVALILSPLLTKNPASL